MSRRWWSDATVTACGLVIGLAWLWLAHVSEPTEEFAPLGVELTLIAVCSVIFLLWRRTRPGVILVALIIASIAFPGVTGLAAAALVGAAARRGLKVVGPVFLLHAALISVLYQEAETTERVYWETVIAVLLVDLVLISVGLLRRSHLLLVRSLEDRARQAEEGQRLRVEEARHLERERLAREMHDVLAHRISLIAVHAGALEVRRDASEAETRAAAVIRECAYDALEDLREVIGVLRGDPDDPDRPQPGLADLPALVEESVSAGARVSLEQRLPADESVPDRVGRHAYRIVQEALTNARKHAPGAMVTVLVEGAPVEGLTVRVTNPASVSVGSLPGAGAGLVGLRERVDLVSGRLEHGWTGDGDFQLRAWLPWRP